MLMRKCKAKILITTIFIFITMMFLHVYEAPAADIRAVIFNEWGSDLVPINIFGQSAQVGEVVEADLDSPIDEYWSDPLPTYTQCIGKRENDISVISRITLYGGKILIFVNHGGGRGDYPGSEGGIEIISPEWEITRVLHTYIMTHHEDTHIYGNGVTVNFNKGVVWWSGRGGCPACACHENQAKIAFIVEKK